MKKIHIISFVLSLVLIFLFMTPAYSVSENSKENTEINKDYLIQKEYDNNLNKLHFYFSDIDETSEKASAKIASEKEVTYVESSFDCIDDLVELNDAVDNMHKYCDEYLEGNEKIQIVVEFNSAYEDTEEYLSFIEEGSKIKTIDDLRSFKKKVAQFSKEYHRQENKKNISKIETIDYKQIDVIDYAPFVIMKIDDKDIEPEILLELADEETVLNVSLSSEEKVESEASWYRTLNAIDVQATVTTGGYTGDGVNIGVLEKGICDTTHTNFDGVNIFVDPNCEKEVTEHATAVTSIIALIAPDANYFVSDNTDVGLSWFIEQGCDVVNCSFGYNNTVKRSGVFDYEMNMAVYRYHIDGLYDYQIRANFINVVNSAGNISNDNTISEYNPYGHITSPGLAYNVITVGGLDCSLGLLGYNLGHAENACYIATNNSTKPEVSAIYSVEIPNVGEKSGTSFAAPQVTACIALLCEKNPSFIWNTNATKATVIGTAKEVDDHTNISNSYFDYEIGSGCISFFNMNICDELTHFTQVPNVNNANSIVSSDTISLSKNVVLQSSLSWSAQFDISNKMCYITNYDIHVYDPDGILVCTSALNSNSTVEFIRYKVRKAGDYTVAVYQNGENPEGVTADYIGYTLKNMFF